MAVAIVDTGLKAKTGTLGTTLTLASQTLTSGANVLVVWTHSFSSIAATGVTFNGSALTSLGSKTHDWFGSIITIQMWYVENPTTGSAADIVATWGSSLRDRILTAASFSGYGSWGTVYTNSPSTNAKSANPTVTIADWASGDYALGGLIDTYYDATEGGTLIAADHAAFNDDIGANSQYKTADGSLTWTMLSEQWATIGARIIPAAATGQPASRRMGGVMFAQNQSHGIKRW